jgi:hypothetical protein
MSHDNVERDQNAGEPLRVLWHQSGVNAKGEPFVQLLLGDEVIAQLDMEDTRAHAQAMLEAAEASEQDAFFLAFLQQTCAMTLEEAGAILVEFRTARLERTNKRGGPRSAREFILPTPKKAGGA